MSGGFCYTDLMSRPSFLSRLFHSRLFLLACVLLIGVLALAVARQTMRNRDIMREITSLEARARSLEQENIRIGDLQQALQTESELEKEARLKLGLKKPGENVVIIKEEVQKPTTFRSLEELTGDPEVTPEHVANPVRWWRYFFAK